MKRAKISFSAILAFAAVTTIGLFYSEAFAHAEPVTTTDLLKIAEMDELLDANNNLVAKTVLFNQTASGGTNATEIAKVTLNYYTSSNCTGTNIPTYTTPNGSSFPVTIGVSFGLVASSAWNVGNAKVTPAIADMTTIQSISIIFRSTNSNTPQANFTGKSYACIPVTCTAGPSGTCTSVSPTQNFTLKTTAAVGDPADGGLIACMGGGLNNLIVQSSDQGPSQWAATSTSTFANSTTDGAANTATIIATAGIGANLAQTCTNLAPAGVLASGWFLPALNQLNCMYPNRAILGMGTNPVIPFYWSSTEFSVRTFAWVENFTSAIQQGANKVSASYYYRCTRIYTP